MGENITKQKKLKCKNNTREKERVKKLKKNKR